MKILFVCTGNTCRSPMAEVIAADIFNKDKNKNNKNDDIEIFSRGTGVFVEGKASKNAVEVMNRRGLDLKNHISKQITINDIKASDLILTMTEAHKNYVLDLDNNANVYLLSEYANETFVPVTDPFGGSLNVYLECAGELSFLIKLAAEKLKKDEKDDKNEKD